MQILEPLEPGVMFWAGRDTLEEIQSLGVRCGQLCTPGDLGLTADRAAEWKAALARAQFTLVTVFAAYEGESYENIGAVQRTVGFIPPATRTAREERTLQLSDFAAAMGVGSIACHIGCVPHDPAHPDYAAVRDVVRRICDRAQTHDQTFALETGQEPATILLKFIQDVGRQNLKINFDPANMVLYGSGDPVDAYRMLAPLVVSIHAKDGDWPPAGVAGALGTERPLGQGSVGMERFVAAVVESGFTGPLNVEREVEDQGQRLRDIRAGIDLLRRLTGRKMTA